MLVVQVVEILNIKEQACLLDCIERYVRLIANNIRDKGAF